MNVTRWITAGSAGLLASTALSPAARAQSSDALLDKLVEKGILSNKEAEELREEADKNFTTAYQVRECERVSQKIKVTLRNIRVENAGGDAFDNLELYGQIWAEGTDSLMLFNKPRDQYVGIGSGQTWPTSGNISAWLCAIA